MTHRFFEFLVAVCVITTPFAGAAAPYIEGAYMAYRSIASVSAVDGVTHNSASELEIRHDRDWVMVPGMALGYGWAKYGVPVRTEIEYLHRARFDFDSRLHTSPAYGFENNLRSDSVHLSAVYDIGLGRNFVVYAGAGFGWNRNWSEVESVRITGGPKEERTDWEDNISWMLMLGGIYTLSDYWSFEMGYRYVDLGDVRSGPFSTGTVIRADSYTSHDSFFGFIFKF